MHAIADQTTLHSLILEESLKLREATALIGPEMSLSYAQLAGVQRTMAAEISRAGVTPSDRVAVVLPQGMFAAAALLAIPTCCVGAPFNPEYTTGEYERLFRLMRIKLLVVGPDFGEAARAAAIRGDVPILEIHPASYLNDVSAPPVPRNEDAPAKREDELYAEDLALLLHTSGSTASPKIVPLTHANLIHSARNVAASLNLSPADRCLNMMPQFHIGALVDLLLAPLAAGASVVCANRIDGDVFLEYLDRFQPTWFQAAPAILTEVLRAAERRGVNLQNTSLRLIRSVSAPLPRSLRSLTEERFGVPVIEIYGMTETAGLITSNPLPPRERPPASAGLPAGPEVAVMDSAGNPVGANGSGSARTGDGIGEVLVRGPTVFAGYETAKPEPSSDADANAEGRHSETASSFIGDWFRTGDAGYIDEQGYLYLTGRLKEMINRGGEKIAPAEIDEALQEHPAILEAAAFALPHETLGEEVAAAIVPRAPAKAPTAKELEAFLNGRLSAYKIPRKIFAIIALPRNSGGKLQRHRVAQSCRMDGANRNIGVDAAATAATRSGPPAPAGTTQSSGNQNQRQTTERMLAGLWRQCLGLDDQPIHPDDDFFDLGGDSLSAVSFLKELERRVHRPIPVTVLLDHPTLGELTQYLSEINHAGAAGKVYDAGEGARDQPAPAKRASDGTASSTSSASSSVASVVSSASQTSIQETPAIPEMPPLAPRVLRDLKTYISAWQGQRPAGVDGLLVARNTIGSRPPLFFGFQSSGEFHSLADSLGGDRPLYGMRSLTDIPGKGRANNSRLAALYLEEIQRVSPRGPYFLGGWCEAGKIVFEVACGLRSRGEGVALLALQDSFVARPYDAPVALFYSSPGNFFHQPAASVRRYYTGPCEIHPWPGEHLCYYRGEGLRAFATTLSAVLDRAERGAIQSSQDDSVPENDETKRVPVAACRAKLRARFPLFAEWSEELTICVRVTNQSESGWEPTAESNITLCSRWLNVAQSQVGRVDGFTAIDRVIRAGESVDIPLTIRVTERHRLFTARILDVDLVEQGARWFQDAGSSPLRFTVVSFRGARIVSRLLPLHRIFNLHRLFSTLGVHNFIKALLRRALLRRARKNDNTP